MSEIEKKVWSYFLGLGLVTEETDHKSFVLKRGALDSVAHLRMVFFIEKEFGIEVASEEVEFETFSSLSSISKFVERKMKDSKA